LICITKELANPVFALSAILSVSSIVAATLRASLTPAPHDISVDSICELLYLTRGVQDVKEAAEEFISSGPFTVLPYGHVGDTGLRVTLSYEMTYVFMELRRMIHDHCSNFEQRTECVAAVNHLQGIYETIFGRLSSTSRIESGIIWCWAATISHDFIKMVHQNCPPALVITAHFTVASLFLRDLWYVGSWGIQAFGGIRFALRGQLGEYLIWAQKQIDTNNAGLRFGSATVIATMR
jgi:hypothetical protein